MDEPNHIFHGWVAWRVGALKEFGVNPPLPRLLLTWFTRGEEWDIQRRKGHGIEFLHPSPESWAQRTRLVNVTFGLVFLIVLWNATRHFFSESAATFAVAVAAFSPSLIAHFSLATADGMAALLMLAVAFQLVRWRRNPSWWSTLLLGLLLGLFLVTKHSALLMAVLTIACVLFLVEGKPSGDPRRWNYGMAALICATCFVVIWSVYDFHVSTVVLHNGQLIITFPNFEYPLVHPLPVAIHANFRLPAAEYLAGLHEMWETIHMGMKSFLLGEVYQGGRIAFFPTVIALKWPLAVVLLVALSVVLLLFKQAACPPDLALMLLLPGAYLASALIGNLNHGERHILPLYPFALLLAAVPFEFARPRRKFLVVALLGLGLHVGDTLRFAPDYLSYFTPLVRTEESFRLLSDCNLDWGQGLIALRNYEQEHPNEKLHVAYFGPFQPAVYGIRATPLAEGQRVTGTVVVSASNLSGVALQDPKSFAWLLRHRRIAMLNHSLHVFEVSPTAAREAVSLEKTGPSSR